MSNSMDDNLNQISNRNEPETQYEDEHVHQVYNSIASHFSSTRFKPWPVVDDFLRGLKPGSIGLDVGCGNGKYLTVRKDVFIVASDRSSELLKFAAQHQPHDAAIADNLSLPHPYGAFDFAISIAVIHHLSTRDRRRDAVRCILETLKPKSVPSSSGAVDTGDEKAGEALIFVWALEQKNSRRGWDTGHEQDVLVPWVLKDEKSSKKGTRAQEDQEANRDNLQKTENKTYQRYYHLYREGELEDDIEAVGGVVVRHGYDRDNWWAVCARGDDNNKAITCETGEISTRFDVL